MKRMLAHLPAPVIDGQQLHRHLSHILTSRTSRTHYLTRRLIHICPAARQRPSPIFSFSPTGFALRGRLLPDITCGISSHDQRDSARPLSQHLQRCHDLCGNFTDTGISLHIKVIV